MKNQNYRPISIIHPKYCINNVKKTMHLGVKNYLESNDQICPKPFGSRKSQTTQTALFSFLNSVIAVLNNCQSLERNNSGPPLFLLTKSIKSYSNLNYSNLHTTELRLRKYLVATHFSYLCKLYMYCASSGLIF